MTWKCIDATTGYWIRTTPSSISGSKVIAQNQQTIQPIPEGLARLHICKIFHKFFPLNIFTWNLVRCCKTPRETCFAIFRRFVGQYPSIVQSCPHKKGDFFHLLPQSDGHNWHFLCRNFVSIVFSFRSTAFWIKTTKFLATWKTAFPQNHNDVTHKSNIPQKMGWCLPSPTISSLTLWRNLVTIITSKAKIVASAGVKGLPLKNSKTAIVPVTLPSHNLPIDRAIELFKLPKDA